MAGEKLHQYDRSLCNYVAWNVCPPTPGEQFVRWLRGWVRGELLDYLLRSANDADPDFDPLLLNLEEMQELRDAFAEVPRRFRREWAPYEPLHKRYVTTIKEVRDALAPSAAEGWSRACETYAQRLVVEGLPLEKGIDIVSDWVTDLRRLLQAMDASHFLPCPEGRSPTPTRPAPSLPPPSDATPPGLTAEQVDAIKRLREAIRSHPGGRTLKPERLVSEAHINRQRGFWALRWLQANGEYDGHSRDRAQRYREGRRNER